jgi:hypothetical protein
MIIFSCIITKNQTVYVHPNPLIYYHDDIMSFYKLKESNKDVSFNYFVKVKIYPTKSNVIDKPIDWRDWNFILDNAGVPQWYRDDQESYEEIIFKEAEKWRKLYKFAIKNESIKNESNNKKKQ